MKNRENLLDDLSINGCSEALGEIFQQLKSEQGLSQKRIKELVPYHHKSVNLSKISSYRAYPGACQKHSRGYLEAVIEHFRLEVALEAGTLRFKIPPTRAAYHYVYYYWRRRNKLGKALLQISETGKEAGMYFFDRAGELLLKYGKGTVRYTHNNIFIHFVRQETESLLVLHKPYSNFAQERFLMGTYTAARILDHAPVAGAVLLEKQPSFAAAKQQIVDTLKEEELITRVLRWAHITTPTEQIYKVPSQSVAKPNADNWEQMRQDLAETIVKRLSEDTKD